MEAKQIIYYADDDVDDREVFTEVVESFGHNVHTFDRGRHLYDAITEINIKPDIVFLDIHMPIDTGLDILKEIKEHPQWHILPVILLSGSRYGSSEIKQYLSYGANFLIPKSTSFNDLRISLEKVLSVDWMSYKPEAEHFFADAKKLLLNRENKRI